MQSYYQLLKEKFPTKTAVLTELINLEAIRHLPKGTEYFVSDLHGEYDAFDSILRSASGSLKDKVRDCFVDHGIDQTVLDDIAVFLFYPEEKLALESQKRSVRQLEDYLESYLPVLIQILHSIGSKYTRSKIRKAMPQEFAYIIEELLAEIERRHDKADYFKTIIKKVRQLRQLDDLAIALAYLIQNLTIDHLHVVGDIYDRGPEPDKILDRLCQLRSVDIQWGNHDITWMGAMAGSSLCMINVIRIAARYNNIDLIEDRYGINLRKLIAYSQAHYAPLPSFTPILDEGFISQEEEDLLNQLQQATAVLQFKLEHQLIDRRPEFLLEHRQLLTKINYETGEIDLDSGSYPLKDFTTSCINPAQPFALSEEEEQLIQQLLTAFQTSERLKRHVDFLFAKGNMYRVYNGQLLYHGCIPLHTNGDFKSLRLNGENLAGRALLDFYEKSIRQSYRQPEVSDDLVTDLFWYLWIGETSSLFGKQAMTTFERYYIADKRTHHEEKNPYFALRNQVQICDRILDEFGLGRDGHIVNGHTPVKEKAGETPIKADGKMLVIDGGFAKGYQKKTGLAGYTLVYNSYGLQLVAHQPFEGVDKVLENGGDVLSTQRLVEEATHRILVKDTTIGQRLQEEIQALEHLYHHFDQY
ncbi:fructose-1,6-bisphosphatase [Streptococcus gallolyticus]|nr:fructose-1,6-bisphosphatase [Streptococcus gallolyticus]MBY5040909.1 fructose-1,6-bisphosphatase [Streptococcus gallolyticus]